MCIDVSDAGSGGQVLMDEATFAKVSSNPPGSSPPRPPTPPRVRFLRFLACISLRISAFMAHPSIICLRNTQVTEALLSPTSYNPLRTCTLTLTLTLTHRSRRTCAPWVLSLPVASTTTSWLNACHSSTCCASGHSAPGGCTCSLTAAVLPA